MEHATHAIILAAGRGERMRPVTDTVPKPLVKVNGKRMIDTVIDALHHNGINNVVGYLKEQFLCLAAQYDGVTLVDNHYADSCNNISSLYSVRHLLANAVIMDGDQLINDVSVLNPEYEHSCYCCTFARSHTSEWLLSTDDDVIINGCNPNGGENDWQLYSVSFWTKADGERLSAQLEEEFNIRRNLGIYWDNIALGLFCGAGYGLFLNDSKRYVNLADADRNLVGRYNRTMTVASLVAYAVSAAEGGVCTALDARYNPVQVCRYIVVSACGSSYSYAARRAKKQSLINTYTPPFLGDVP